MTGLGLDLQEDRRLRALLAAVIDSHLAFTLRHVRLPSNDLWEEQSGYHYYTQLLQAEALMRGSGWLESAGRRDQARAVRRAGEETLVRLDAFWNEAAGWYDSRMAGESRNPRRGALS